MVRSCRFGGTVRDSMPEPVLLCGVSPCKSRNISRMEICYIYIFFCHSSTVRHTESLSLCNSRGKHHGCSRCPIHAEQPEMINLWLNCQKISSPRFITVRSSGSATLRMNERPQDEAQEFLDIRWHYDTSHRVWDAWRVEHISLLYWCCISVFKSITSIL